MGEVELCRIPWRIRIRALCHLPDGDAKRCMVFGRRKIVQVPSEGRRRRDGKGKGTDRRLKHDGDVNNLQPTKNERKLLLPKKDRHLSVLVENRRLYEESNSVEFCISN